MNIDTGYLRSLEMSALKEHRLDMTAFKEQLREREILVAKRDEEAVINMNRQQRRAWARRQAKALV